MYSFAKYTFYFYSHFENNSVSYAIIICILDVIRNVHALARGDFSRPNYNIYLLSSTPR